MYVLLLMIFVHNDSLQLLLYISDFTMLVAFVNRGMGAPRVVRTDLVAEELRDARFGL